MGFEDNFELEKIIGNANANNSNPAEEFYRLLKDSRLIMPVLMSEIDAKSDFEINYIKIGGDKQAVALFTSEKIMDESGIRSAVITIRMSDLAEMLLGMPDKYAVISVNPVTGLSVNIPTESFLNLFY
ncbi:SseB family protein [Methanobrevibacter sp.]